jgi:hypothetical protein
LPTTSTLFYCHP